MKCVINNEVVLSRSTPWRICPIAEHTGVFPLLDSPAGVACCGIQPLAETTGSHFKSCQL
jgi:hypothetical protein